MSETTRPNDDNDLEEQTVINEQMGVPPDAARSAAEDRLTLGPRKPSSDEVEQERIEQARVENERL